MPVFDLSVSELQAYAGTNPCPADLDAYWDEALEEMGEARRDEDIEVTIYPDFEHEDLPGIGDRILSFFVDQLGPMTQRKSH